MWLVHRLQRRQIKMAVVTLNRSLRKDAKGRRWRRVFTGTQNRGVVPAGDFAQPFLDESLLLAESLNCPVFECAHRMEAWKDLSQPGCPHTEKGFDAKFEKKYDLILFDGGLQDPALGGEYLPESVKVRKFLIAENQWPQRMCDLIPAGPWRSFLKDHRDISGKWQFEESLAGVWRGSVLAQKGLSWVNEEQNEAHLSQNSDVAFLGWRSILERLKHEDEVHLICGIGNPYKLLAQLQKCGLNIAPEHQHLRPDHDRQFCEFLKGFIRKEEVTLLKKRRIILMTTKDWVRLDEEMRAHQDIFVISRDLRRIPQS